MPRTRPSADRPSGASGPPARLALPPPDVERWSARRKAAVVVAARQGMISTEEACRRYRLSPEEFAAWEAALDTRGLDGLRTTRPAERRRHRAGGRAPPAESG